MSPHAQFIACLAAAACAGVVQAAANPACEIMFYGLVADADGETPGSEAVGDGGTAKFDSASFEPEPTSLIPAVLGTHFGVARKLENIPAGEAAQLVITHPPITMPDGTRVARSVRRVAAASYADGYRFDEPYELAPGDWVFEYLYRGERLCRHVFHVIPIEFRSQ
jgi:hypothetical protein